MFDQLFTAEQRRIFSVPAGDGAIHFDPVRVRRRLFEFTGGELNAMLDGIDTFAKQYAYQSGSEDGTVQPALIAQRSALEGRLAAAAYFAFELPPIDRETGAGYTEGEALAFLNAFTEFEQKKSASTGTTPTT